MPSISALHQEKCMQNAPTQRSQYGLVTAEKYKIHSISCTVFCFLDNYQARPFAWASLGFSLEVVFDYRPMTLEYFYMETPFEQYMDN